MGSGHRLVRVDPKARTLHCANGKVDPYEALVSSSPLPELVPIIDGAPADVVEGQSHEEVVRNQM